MIILSGMAIYLAIGMLYSGDCWTRPQNWWEFDKPIWSEFLPRLLFWPAYIVGLVLLVLICLVGEVAMLLHKEGRE